MRTFKLWMLAVILICVTTAGLVSCIDKIDNPSQPTTEVEEEDDFQAGRKLEIAASEFQPTDISTALLGSLSGYAEEEVVRYWFTNLTTQVTDETMVVITDEITADNEEAIAEVLNRYGMLLVVDPKEDNVKQYAEALGIDPDADYSTLELIGLTGLGDQFLSYNNGKEAEASDEPVAPSSIAEDDIWDIAPAAYLRLKAFAEWVEQIDKKYTDYLAYLIEHEKEILAVADELDNLSSRAFTRSDEKETDTDKLNLVNLPGVDRKVHAVDDEVIFESYDNVGRSNDKDTCVLSVTCNYHFIPVYKFPEGKEPGSDYYIVETYVGWDCTKTLKGWKKHDHGSGRDRRSFLFFPLECKFYSKPTTTNGSYSVQMTSEGLWPDAVKAEKTITDIRSFNIDGNVSGGVSGGKEKGKQGETNTSGSNISGNFDASLGIGASWSKEETFTVQQWNVGPYVSDATVGHIITVPGGDDGWHPRLKSRATGDIEVPNGVNFKQTLPVKENWIWRVSGTQVGTDDEALTVTFGADITVGWYSYFLPSHGLDEKLNSATVTAKTIKVSPPDRTDAGFFKIIAASQDNDGKKLHIFRVKAIDVTDKNNPIVVADYPVATKYGKTLSLGLPANRTYSIELQMGAKRADQQTYVLSENWTVQGRTTEELDTDIDFELKKIAE